jgi:hypothetical protein
MLTSSRGDWAERKDSESWLNAPSAKEAAARVTHGWPEGARRVLSSLADLDVPVPVSVRRRIARADQGDELDIHAVNRGDLATAWTMRRRRHARGSFTVRLVAQANLLGKTTPDELFWRGAAIVKLADALTAAGYSVEIVGAISSNRVKGVDGDFLVTFPLKEAAAPLDVEALAGVLCNAGFHRLYGFRLYFALATRHHGEPGSASSDTSGRVLRQAALDADGVKTFTVPYAIGSKALAEAWIAASVATLDASHHDQEVA